MSHLHFAVMGFGSSVYADAGHFCTAAVRADAALAALGGLRVARLLRVTDTKELANQASEWQLELQSSISAALRGVEIPKARGIEGNAAAEAAVAQTADQEGQGEEDSSDSEDDSSTTVSSGEAAAKGSTSDVEELAEGCAGDTVKKPEERQMLTTKHRAQLTKEGYKIVGSHSAVKLCRWTKHQLRGRGGCYKHSFYGITSYQCMEATPSLACANKCVFCWRHHKNPVGTEWKWSMDPPDQIVAEGIDQHRRMIRECKGIPGVQKERFEEAMTVRHCALSLVGEPIMYPRINELVGELHQRKISTFLVTNAQFPEAIRNLDPITQLYVSVDAGTPETLKAVDRPLFSDFWQRYLDSLKALKAKKQRTVYRLTLVKGHNMEEAANYAKLVALGTPDFIEIKSVTFCGESKASSLTIQCTPWHEEVKAFSEAMLSKEGLESQYELACEHQHSCIVLLAHKRYKVDGRWHTWIDYDRFHELVKSGVEFDATDYWAPTPEWALYGSEEAGFDPNETRVYHNRTKKRAQAGLLSKEQLKMYPDNPAKQ
ncbi:TYW1 [Symbiodinium sp. CCMP2456]|nr:TYW1 [Symbiodinium sp. CCMP2456]